MNPTERSPTLRGLVTETSTSESGTVWHFVPGMGWFSGNWWNLDGVNILDQPAWTGLDSDIKVYLGDDPPYWIHVTFVDLMAEELRGTR